MALKYSYNKRPEKSVLKTCFYAELFFEILGHFCLKTIE